MSTELMVEFHEICTRCIEYMEIQRRGFKIISTESHDSAGTVIIKSEKLEAKWEINQPTDNVGAKGMSRNTLKEKVVFKPVKVAAEPEKVGAEPGKVAAKGDKVGNEIEKVGAKNQIFAKSHNSRVCEANLIGTFLLGSFYQTEE